MQAKMVYMLPIDDSRGTHFPLYQISRENALFLNRRALLTFNISSRQDCRHEWRLGVRCQLEVSFVFILYKSIDSNLQYSAASFFHSQYGRYTTTNSYRRTANSTSRWTSHAMGDRTRICSISRKHTISLIPCTTGIFQGWVLCKLSPLFNLLERSKIFKVHSVSKLSTYFIHVAKRTI